ncbi:signal peptidase I [Paenibacillus pasadenensis]|uniref:signal peptidase I n=1 Tax=Paenibacillus pasadenensis TaxID=217090 RepID=UPI0020404E3B|nr:signal peptidase I [Paenibacillus pasadenensis]MCM3746120.1 signal peptidase I [Paenibacillus pasadenensis]
MKNCLLILTTMLTLLVVVGCTNNEKISDSKTRQEIDVIDQKGDLQEVFYPISNMVNEETEYYIKNVLIDPNYYKNNLYNRGDIVYFNVPTGFKVTEDTKKQISRVIALEGEKLTVKKGRIYINDMELDSFYSQLKAEGMTGKEFFEKDLPSCDEACQKTYRDFFNTSIKELTVPNGFIFVISDNSISGYDSLTLGPLSVDQVIGKVVGYKKEK